MKDTKQRIDDLGDVVTRYRYLCYLELDFTSVVEDAGLDKAEGASLLLVLNDALISWKGVQCEMLRQRIKREAEEL